MSRNLPNMLLKTSAREMVYRQNGGKSLAWFYLLMQQRSRNYQIQKNANHLMHLPAGYLVSMASGGLFQLYTCVADQGYFSERRLSLLCRRVDSS